MISEKGNKIRQAEANRVYNFIFCFDSENIISLVVPSTNDIQYNNTSIYLKEKYLLSWKQRFLSFNVSFSTFLSYFKKEGDFIISV